MVGDIQMRLDAAYERLGPRLKVAARYVLDHPEDVALHSLRTLAGRAGVAPATLSRLARAVDCGDYEEFRRDYWSLLRGDGFSLRARLLRSAEEGAEPLARAQARAVDENIEGFLAAEPQEALDQAAEILLSAHSVQVVGMLSSFSLAAFAHYVASMALPRWSLLRTQGGSLADSLYDLTPRDAVLAFGSEPYARATVLACRQARESGAKIVAVTDRRSGPLARAADVALVAGAESPSFFPSMAAQMTVLEGLLATLLKRAGDEAVAKLEAIEAARRAYGEFWTETGAVKSPVG